MAVGRVGPVPVANPAPDVKLAAIEHALALITGWSAKDRKALTDELEAHRKVAREILDRTKELNDGLMDLSRREKAYLDDVARLESARAALDSEKTAFDRERSEALESLEREIRQHDERMRAEREDVARQQADVSSREKAVAARENDVAGRETEVRHLEAATEARAEEVAGRETRVSGIVSRLKAVLVDLE